VALCGGAFAGNASAPPRVAVAAVCSLSLTHSLALLPSKKRQPFVEQGNAVLALFPPSYDYIFLPVAAAASLAAAAALALVGAAFVAEGAGQPLPPQRLRLLPPHAPAPVAASPAWR